MGLLRPESDVKVDSGKVLVAVYASPASCPMSVGARFSAATYVITFQSNTFYLNC